MKELSIEEKAKRYDEVINEIKNLRDILLENGVINENGVIYDNFNRIFPELEESEDERIRKKLIALIEWSKSYAASGITTDEAKEMITYLEKQGEQKPVEPQQDMLSQEKYAKAVDECIYGEHKPAEWSEEDEKMIRGLIVICDEWTTRHSFYPIENCEIEKLKNWLKSLKERVLPQPKQEWKQENTDDLTKFENSMMHIGNSFFGQHAGLDPNDTNTIKEQANLLLELVPKQEWSKEDENNILFLTSIIEEYFKDKEKITLCGDTVCANFTKKDVIDRLKSLRPQSTWKPSDEQMHILYKYAEQNNYDGSVLTSLYQDLKKLRGE